MKKDDSNVNTIPEAYRGRVYMRRKECAAASGLTVDYFDRLAWKGEGPPFVKTSKRGPCLYSVLAFFSWLSKIGSGEK